MSSPIIGFPCSWRRSPSWKAFAYVMHRWVMHGRLGWLLHASHHRPRAGRFELNDLYGVIFAVPSIVLLYGGVQGGWGAWATWVGAGIAGLWRDLFRLPRRHRPSPGRASARPALDPISSASSRRTGIHHAVESREGTVSFGFIYAPPVERAEGRARRQARAGGSGRRRSRPQSIAADFAGRASALRRTPRSPARTSPLSKC